MGYKAKLKLKFLLTCRYASSGRPNSFWIFSNKKYNKLKHNVINSNKLGRACEYKEPKYCKVGSNVIDWARNSTIMWTKLSIITLIQQVHYHNKYRPVGNIDWAYQILSAFFWLAENGANLGVLCEQCSLVRSGLSLS